MHVATFSDSSEWAGKTISYEDGRFRLQDFGAITPKAILESDRRGQIVWANEGARAWVESLGAAAPAPSTPGETKRGLNRGARLALVAGAVVVVVIVIAATVLNSTSSDTPKGPTISGSELHQRLAAQTPTEVAECRVSDGQADVVLKDSYASQPYLATLQKDCFDTFRVMFAPGTGLTNGTVEVRIVASDQFGLDQWDPAYRVSLADEVAAKVDWKTATPKQLGELWTVELQKPFVH